jgi:hypothetical protein
MSSWACEDGTVHILDLNGRHRHEVLSPFSSTSITCFLSCNVLLIGEVNGTVRLVVLRTGDDEDTDEEGHTEMVINNHRGCR